jgi:hypothetical protein
MGQKASNAPQAGISGQTIVNELIRNMETGRLEMGYSILLPCIFSIYLHPDDYRRLAGVQDLIREDARRALTARMAEWNGKGSIFRRGGPRKTYKIAQNDWWIEFFSDGENAIPLGDVEIHSELNDVAQPGYRGVKTTLVDREPSVTSLRAARDRASSRTRAQIFAEIRYRDDSGPQTYLVTQNEIRIGRAGEDVWLELPLYTGDEVSREHCSIRRDPNSGAFAITDLSRNGTWLNGRRLPKGVEERIPDRAEIGVADVVKLAFEVRR